MRERNDVHATGSDLCDADFVGCEVGVEAGALDVNRVPGRAEAQLARCTFAEDIDVKALGWRLVDDRALLEGLEGLDFLDRRS